MNSRPEPGDSSGQFILLKRAQIKSRECNGAVKGRTKQGRESKREGERKERGSKSMLEGVKAIHK